MEHKYIDSQIHKLTKGNFDTIKKSLEMKLDSATPEKNVRKALKLSANICVDGVYVY